MFRRTMGIIIVILAILVAVVPQLTKCPSDMSVMICPYTAKAELALSLPILLEGLFLIFGSGGSSMGLAVVGIGLGVSVILVPYSLIGVDRSPMHCATIMKPSLLLFGVALILANAGLLWSSAKKPR